MGKFKGILKRIGGGLKIASALAPLVIAAGATLTGLGLVCGCAAVETNTLKDYQETAIYASEYDKSVAELEAAHEAGEIGNYEYKKELEKLDTEDFVIETLGKDIEGNEVYQGKLKLAEDLKLAHIVLMATGIAGGIACPIFYMTNGNGFSISVKLWTSGENDIRQASSGATPPPKKNKTKPVKKNVNNQSVSAFGEGQPTEKMVFGEEKLPNIEDTYYND